MESFQLLKMVFTKHFCKLFTERFYNMESYLCKFQCKLLFLLEGRKNGRGHNGRKTDPQKAGMGFPVRDHGRSPCMIFAPF